MVTTIYLDLFCVISILKGFEGYKLGSKRPLTKQCIWLASIFQRWEDGSRIITFSALAEVRKVEPRQICGRWVGPFWIYILYIYNYACGEQAVS